jgi:hypothetical protein
LKRKHRNGENMMQLASARLVGANDKLATLPSPLLIAPEKYSRYRCLQSLKAGTGLHSFTAGITSFKAKANRRQLHHKGATVDAELCQAIHEVATDPCHGLHGLS